MISIPVIVILQNDSELTRYKNHEFLPFTKLFIENYGIIKNTIFFCADDESEKLCMQLGLNNIHRCKEEILSDKTTFLAINDYFMNEEKDADWCIILKPYQIIKDSTILYKSIQNINDNYDIIAFSSHMYDMKNITVPNNHNLETVTFDSIENTKKVLTILDDSLFVAKTSFLKQSFIESKGDVKKYSKLLASGKILILDSVDEIQIHFTSINQINMFMHFLSEIKYKADII